MAENWGFSPCEGNAFFVSYNSHDWRIVAPIANELASMGYPVWYDYGLEAGTSTWREQISIHIDRAHAVILFITNGIFLRDSSYVINEYREAKQIGKVVIPVFLDAIELRNIEPKYRSYVTEGEDLQGVMGVNYDAAGTAKCIADAINASRAINLAMPQDKKSPIGSYVRIYKPAESSLMTKVNRGTRISFGNYPQSSDTPEPIVWRVLDVVNGKALMISESLLDCKMFNYIYKNATWENCSLRKWLNFEFLKNAFSFTEMKKLCIVNECLEYSGKDECSAVDFVSCLSVEETKKYFVSEADRMAKPTSYAKRGRCLVDSEFQTSYWWLRKISCNISPHGQFCYFDDPVDGVDYGGVRPVILVQL